MRILSSCLASRAGKLANTTLISFLALSSFASTVAAITFTPAPSPNLRLDDLGRVALAGNFDGLSLFEYLEQNENSCNTNGSQSILSRFPNGAFASVSSADAHIKTMCPLVVNGAVQGVVVGGNFTSLGGIQAQGIALVDPATGGVTPLPGLSGKVASLYCDTTSGYVYVGGDLNGLNSSNAIIWTTQWTNMPFNGFNGPVHTIAKAPNGNIIFGGKFDGLGNSTGGFSERQNNTQVIPLASGDVTALYSIERDGFNDPRNIICKTADTDGAGNTWLAPDNTPSYWQGTFRFGFVPQVLRLYNTQFEGRGTKTFRFTALPDTGIMNLTYINNNGETAYCDATCPLPEGNTTVQEFGLVDDVGMNGFRIDISEWYGAGAGLAGIELRQDDIYSYAINDFNEPACASSSNTAASATTTGPWIVTPSIDTTSDYLSVRVNETVPENAGIRVVFQPNLDQSGNYSVKIFTPGCIQDGTCNLRGRVNITGDLAPSATGDANQPVSTEIFQTNNFDKYDEVYRGFIDATSDGFQPSITLQPSVGQTPELGFLTFVAQRVRFELISPTDGGLNGLFEYNPNQQTVDTDFENSAINRAGQELGETAIVKEIAVEGDEIFVGGNFTSDSYSNIFKIFDNNATSLAQGGLNNEVMAFHHDGQRLYVGGNFTNTRDDGTDNLNGIALYSISDNTWSPLGAGVNGVVQSIVPVPLNFTNGQAETVLAVSGLFDRVLEFGDNPSSPVQGFAMWVPSLENWLQNTDLDSISVRGRIVTQTEIPGFPSFFAGSVSSQGLAVSGAVGLRDSDGLKLQPLPLRLQSSYPMPVSRKRAATLNGQNITGAATGLIYEQDDLNYTVIAGNFVAAVPDGSNVTNLLIINGTEGVTGLRDELPSESTFVAVGIQTRQTPLLFAGGSLSGTVGDNKVNGIVIYDLQSARLSDNQPEGLASDEHVIVNAIAVQRESDNVFVGGTFQTAGSLSCPSICIYNTQQNQWNQPGSGLSGPVSVLQWATDNRLLIGGALIVGPNRTTLATYDTESGTFSSFPGAENIPGPVTAFSAANGDRTQFWVGGTADNGTAFIQKYDGSQWHSIGHLLDANSVVTALQVMPLSEDHDDSDLIEDNRALFVMGQLNVPNYGNASSALFNGTAFTPFIISTTTENTGGSITHAFVQRENFFSNGGGGLAVGFVVLIALAISLGLIALIVLAGILAERWRRRRDGYMPANQNMMSGAGGGGNMSRIRPQDLFGTLGGKDTTPKI